MEIELKWFFTAILAAVSVIVMVFVDRGDNGDADAHLWRGGADDQIRRLLFCPDGRLKPWSKVGLIVWFIVGIAVLWLIVP